MDTIKSLYYVAFMVFILLFGSRDLAFLKDFFYFDPPLRIRRILYIRHVPTGKISLTGLIAQCITIAIIVLQVLTLSGVHVLEPFLGRVWFGVYAFKDPDDLHLQIISCVMLYMFLTVVTILYIFICALFAPKRIDVEDKTPRSRNRGDS